MALEFIDFNVTIPSFNKLNVSLPSITDVSLPSLPTMPYLELGHFSDYEHGAEAFIRGLVSKFNGLIEEAISALLDDGGYGINNEIGMALVKFKVGLWKLQEKYYSEIRSLRDKMGSVSCGIAHGSLLYAYNKVMESSLTDIYSMYIDLKRSLLDILRQSLASIFERLLFIWRSRDQITDEISRLIDVVRNFDITKQTAVVSNVIDYHNTLVDLYSLYAEAQVLIYTARMTSLLKAEARAKELLAEINTAELDNTLKTVANEILLLNVDKNILEQRVASLEMYEEIRKLEEYEAVLSRYNADIRRFAAEVDKVFMPYRVFSTKADAASYKISAQESIVSTNREKVGVARLLVDSDFDLKSAKYSEIRGKIAQLRGDIANKEAEFRQAIENARATLDTEYFSKLMEYVENLRSSEEDWIDSISRDEKAVRLITMLYDKITKLYRTTTERDATTAMRVDTSNLLGLMDKASEVVRASVVGCSQVTAEIIRQYGEE